MTGPQQGNSFAHFGIGDANAVARRAEMHFLVQRRRRQWGARARPRCALRRRLADLADEADAFARDSADQALFVAAVADRLADGVDAAGQRRF